jgi:hypothetical protein
VLFNPYRQSTEMTALPKLEEGIFQKWFIFHFRFDGAAWSGTQWVECNPDCSSLVAAIIDFSSLWGANRTGLDVTPCAPTRRLHTNLQRPTRHLLPIQKRTRSRYPANPVWRGLPALFRTRRGFALLN